MKKLILIMAIALCTFTAQATNYAYLIFTNTSGVTTAVDVTNLTLTVNGSQLQVTNSSGTIQFTLTDLAAMQFSSTDTLTGLQNVLGADSPVEVYSLTGVRHGSFQSLLQAVSSLGKGTYVVTDGKNAQKIIVQ